MTTTLARNAMAFVALLLSAASVQAAGLVTAKNGMTLYVFDKDTGGMSSCYDACAKMWPAYLGKTADKLTEGWTLVKRTDGKMQWAYDAKPLYFFKDDKKKGDVAGDGMSGVWHVIKEWTVSTATIAAASSEYRQTIVGAGFSSG